MNLGVNSDVQHMHLKNIYPVTTVSVITATQLPLKANEMQHNHEWPLPRHGCFPPAVVLNVVTLNRFT